jgi:hypothetical protein
MLSKGLRQRVDLDADDQLPIQRRRRKAWHLTRAPGATQLQAPSQIRAGARRLPPCRRR